MAIPDPDGQRDTVDVHRASTRRQNPIGTIGSPCGSELRHEGDARPLSERLRPIIERYRALPDSGDIADKAFFDDLSGNS